MSEPLYDQECLAIAFVAGWLATGEGWNGKYPGLSGAYDLPKEDVMSKVMESFDMWMLDVSLGASE